MKAPALLRYLGHPRKRIHAKLIASSTERDDAECIRLEIDVDLPQRPVQDVRTTERILVRFPPHDALPEVFALRKDFPRVAHLVLGRVEFPRQLCLYERPWADERSNWSPRSFVERIRGWFRGTADGTIHPDDQALEAVMQTSTITAVLPAPASPPGKTVWVETVYFTKISDDYFTALKTPPPPPANPPPIPVFFVRTPPVDHGIMSHSPENLEELEDILKFAGISLTKTLAAEVAGMRNEFKVLQKHGLPMLLVLALPKRRHAGRTAETVEHQAFVADPVDFFREERIETMKDGIIVLETRLAIEDPAKLKAVRISGVALRWHLEPRTAAAMNGQPHLSPKVLAIGAGALGSQVTNNLCRGGFGTWTILDNDRLEPHNPARHLLTTLAVGSNKAEALVKYLEAVFPGYPAPAWMDANYLQPQSKAPAVAAALQAAELVFDFSASVPVQRKLACDLATQARRASAFLNPRGDESVLLVEDAMRQMPLIWLEALYMQAVASDPQLAGHFDDAARAAHRYGNGCRDLSATVPQDAVALHAGLLSAGLRNGVCQGQALVSVQRWKRQTGAVAVISIPVSLPFRCSMGDWSVFLHPAVLEALATERTSHLPNETGGILLGLFDRTHRYVAVTSYLPAPADSEAWPTSFLRGNNGLSVKVDQCARRTLGNLGYVGEWHSHPKGHDASPSNLDLEAVKICSVDMAADALPTLMLIVGEHELGVLLQPAETDKILSRKIPR